MKGICFIEPLFHKVVKGEKTQTRRVATHQHFSYSELSNVKQGVYIYPAIPKYNVGEIVYLKEPYSYLSLNNQEPVEIYKYGEDYSDIEEVAPIKWKNKLFMPESVARCFIKITGVKAERLQDISDEDCSKEGIECFTKDNRVFKFGLDGWEWSDMPRSPKDAYASLIDKINGKGTWDKNPWVWVYDFELI